MRCNQTEALRSATRWAVSSLVDPLIRLVTIIEILHEADSARGELVDTESPATGGQSGELVGTVLLVGVGLDGERLLVIPEAWARRELRSYATLRSARSYRDLLADDDAAETVVDALQRSLQDLDEDLDVHIDGRELCSRSECRRASLRH